MSNLAQTIGAGLSVEFVVVGDFLRLMAATDSVEIIYYRYGAEVARTGSVKAGYAERLAGSFDKVVIKDKSGLDNAVEILYRSGGDVRYDRSAGSVEVTSAVPARGDATQGGAIVTNASGLLVAANAARSYLLVQNNDAVGVVYLNLAGGAAAVAGGVKIAAGGALELNSNMLTGAIYAIGDIASNANITVVEA